MKRKNEYPGTSWGAVIIIILLITAALWAAWNLLRTGDDRVRPKVSVLVEDSNNERWTAFRLGLEQAATEYGADVTYITSTGFSSAGELKSLLSQEAAAGTNAMILSLYDSEETDFGEGAMKLVYVETDGIRDSSAGTAAVVPDGCKMGHALGEMMLEDAGQAGNGEPDGSAGQAGNGEPDGSAGQTGNSDPDRSAGQAGNDDRSAGGRPAPSVAVIAGNLRKFSEKEMLQGLTETVESAGGSIRILESNGEEPAALMEQAAGCDMIAVLEDALLVQAAATAASGEEGERRLYGVGCSPSSITYLDRGVISGMVVPNEFTMGYLSLAQLSQYLANDILQMKDIEVGFTCVRSDEVHEKANEKLLFLPIR